MRLFIALLLAASMMVPSALGASTMQCLNSTHFEENAEIVIDGNTTTIDETIECTHGCSEDLQRCKPSPWTSNILALALITFIVFITSYFIRKHNIFGLVLSAIMAVGIFIIGFVDIFSGTMHLLFALMSLLMIAAIGISAILMLKDEKGRMHDPDDD